jgi:hypothetical protein
LLLLLKQSGNAAHGGEVIPFAFNRDRTSIMISGSVDDNRRLRDEMIGPASNVLNKQMLTLYSHGGILGSI